MPKENTHLFFADKALKGFTDERLKKEISPHLIYYYLGSMIPDSCYYRKATNTVSERIHGKDGYSSNKMVFALLENIKNERDLIFTFGYLTHCALDITFHPAIDFLSAVYPKEGLNEKESASYFHMHIETELDTMLNQKFFIDKMIKASLIEHVIFPEIISSQFAIPSPEVKKSLHQQLFLNHLFRLRSGFMLFFPLNRLGIIDKPKQGLFYENLKKEKPILKDGFKYRTSSGEPKIFDINGHLTAASSLAEQFIKTSLAYAKDKITKEECAKTIAFTKLSP